MQDQDKQTLAELARLETYYRAFNASPNFISISRLADGTFIDVNPAFERFTGLKREQVVGRTSFDINLYPYPEERADFAKAIAPVGELHGYPAHMHNHSGEICDIEVSANIAPINGELVLIAVVHDVTKRKRDENELKKYRDQLEELVTQRTAELQQANLELRETNRKLEEAHNQLLQTEKMASIGQLAAGVAHEINNPIGFVNSNLGSLDQYIHNLLRLIDTYEQNEAALAQQPQALQAIQAVKQEVDLAYIREDIFTLLEESQDGMQRVKKIVQDLKDFSHVGFAEWQFADLHKGLDSTLNIVNNEIKYKAKVVKEYGEIPQVECLPLELNQVFMNMLVNAAHAIESFGQIVVRTGMQNNEVWVEISDNGSGISPENRKRIFDPFFTTKPIGKGTGLGLSLSFGIVQKHHGRIEVESEVGKGTRFRVWLPMQQEKAAG